MSSVTSSTLPMPGTVLMSASTTTFMPGKRLTKRSGRSARSVRTARSAVPMVPEL